MSKIGIILNLFVTVCALRSLFGFVDDERIFVVVFAFSVVILNK